MTGLCTTLSYVALADSERLVGDAMQISFGMPSKYVGVNDLAGAVDLRHDTLGSSDCARSERTCDRQPQPELLRRFLVSISGKFPSGSVGMFGCVVRCDVPLRQLGINAEDAQRAPRDASASQGLSTGLAKPSSERPDGEFKKETTSKTEACTEFETLCTFDAGADDASLVVATARTNVANQIQRHLLHKGFPVCTSMMHRALFLLSVGCGQQHWIHNHAIEQMNALLFLSMLTGGTQSLSSWTHLWISGPK